MLVHVADRLPRVLLRCQVGDLPWRILVELLTMPVHSVGRPLSQQKLVVDLRFCVCLYIPSPMISWRTSVSDNEAVRHPEISNDLLVLLT